MSKKSTAWTQVADWYQQLLQNTDTFQNQVILPNLLRWLNPQIGQKILDVACGQGYFSMAFRKLGAEVVGIDLSEELILRARENAIKEKLSGINFMVGDATNLDLVARGNFDQATIILALQNMESVKEVLVGVAKNLKSNGKLFLVLNHPAFRIPKFSSWGFDQTSKIEFRRVDKYLSDLKIKIEAHPSLKNSASTISFHRPLQHYFKALRKTGFVVTGLEEWTTHKRSDSGPRARAENLAKKEIPMFLFLEATKLGDTPGARHRA